MMPECAMVTYLLPRAREGASQIVSHHPRTHLENLGLRNMTAFHAANRIVNGSADVEVKTPSTPRTLSIF